MIRIKNNVAPKLPNEYQEVEYIESTGSQYVDTGVNAENNMNMEAKILLPNAVARGSNLWLCSARSSNKHFTFAQFGYFSDTKSTALNAYNDVVTNENKAIVPFNEQLKIEAVLNNGSQLLTINNKEIINTTTTGDVNMNMNLFIFARNYVNTVVYETPYRVYNLKLFNNDILIRNFIPCYRKADNEVGLYDLVNNQFYTNAGTGVFLMGEAVGTTDANLMPMVGNKKLLKRYVGENLVYQKNGDTFFTSCPFPTSWTEVTHGTKYKATNEYGEWNIWANTYLGTENSFLYFAFDRNNDTSWMSAGHSDSTTAFEIGINLPINFLINPSSIYIKSSRASGTSSSRYAKIMGYNPLTGNWEKLGEFLAADSATEENFTVDQANFFSKFKLVMYRHTSTKDKNSVYEFQITSGTLRKEN